MFEVDIFTLQLGLIDARRVKLRTVSVSVSQLRTSNDLADAAYLPCKCKDYTVVHLPAVCVACHDIHMQEANSKANSSKTKKQGVIQFITEK